MIDIKELKFGNMIFKINERLVWFRDKIYMTDENGVEWFRYDKDKVEYDIVAMTYCGKRFVVERGECEKDDDLSKTEYHFKLNDGSLEWFYEEEFDLELTKKNDYFYTHFEAQQEVDKRKETMK